MLALTQHMPGVANALAWLDDRAQQLADETSAIARIPAETFAEQRRADYVHKRLSEIGATGVQRFGHGNVAVRLGPDGPAGVAVLAHLDTVFAESVEHVVTARDGRLFGPGVGDNSAGICGVLALAEALLRCHVTLARPVWVVFDVGEEGLGDLLGVRETLTHFDGRLDALLAIEGTMLGRLGHIAVGSRRLRVCFTAEGGHSWLDFGRPSAVHAAVKAAAAIAGLSVPSEPRTSFNIGRIEGGQGVNVIAPSAEFLIDLRSVSSAALDTLAKHVQRLLDDAAREPGIDVRTEMVGYRPAGAIPRDHALVELCAAVLRRLGHAPISTASSTDANIPLSQGIPALALGITEGAGIHSKDEWIAIEPMRRGVQQLVLVCAALAGKA